MKINYHSKALKFLQKQEAKTNKRIISAINNLPDGDIKKLEGYSNKYRLRIGSFRIIFSMLVEIDYDTNQKIRAIKIWDIDNRGDVY